jgi:hypothetical protein
MNFNFNWSAVSGGAPHVTISLLGISFNSVSISKLGNPDKIVVGFDEEKFALGIKAYKNELNAKAYKFAGRSRDGWIKIGCRAFIKRLQELTDIDFSTAQRYTATFDAEKNILIVRVKREPEESGLGE